MDGESTPINVNEAGEHGSAPPFTPQSPAEQHAHDDINRVLADFQLGLTSLKQLYEQRVELQQQLLQREAELASRDAQLATQQSDFEAASARFSQQLRELEEARAAQSVRERELHDRIAGFETEMIQQGEELARAREDHAAHEALARRALEAATTRQSEIEREFQARSAEFARLVQEKTTELERARAEHTEENRRAQEELDAARATLDRRAEELTELATRLEQQGTELAQARTALLARETEATRLRAEVDKSGSALASKNRQTEAINRELGELRAQAQGLRELVGDFEQLWGIERNDNATLAHRLEAAHAAFDRHNAEVESLRKAARGGEQDTKRLSGERASLEQSLIEAREKLASLESEVAGLRARHAEEIAQWESQARLAREEREQAIDAELDSLREQLRVRDSRIQEMTSRVASAEAHAAALRGTLEQSKRPRLVTSGTFVERRKQRLKLYRLAVKRQITKVKKASDALSKRFEQCEQVLGQRAELAAARHRIIEGEKRIQRSKARSRAALVTLCAVAVVGIVGALSWAVAREVAPATFIAHASIKADGRGRELNEAELDEWRKFHTDLLNDPRFHEEAAERFARQGSPSLGAAPAVAALVANHLTTDAASIDQLRLDLRGQGKEATRRTLESLTASLASFANAAQQRRIDGGATIVPAPPTVDDEPLDQTRLYYALGMMGGGVSVASLLALTIWRKLAGVKSSFERDTQMAALLDEANWIDPRKE